MSTVGVAPEIAPLLAMFAAVSPVAQFEVARACRSEIALPAAKQARVAREADLGALAEMLAAAVMVTAAEVAEEEEEEEEEEESRGRQQPQHDDEHVDDDLHRHQQRAEQPEADHDHVRGGGHRVARGGRWHRARAGDAAHPPVRAVDYDRQRPESAPTARTLARRHGSWRRACALAWAMTAPGAGRAWASTRTGGAKAARYTPDEARAAVRAYARECGELPRDPHAFRLWRAARLGEPRAAGKPLPRWPSFTLIARRLGRGSWKRAMENALITPDEIDEYRRALLTAMRLPTTSAGADDQRAAAPSLAGRRLSAASISERRKEMGLSHADLLRAAGLSNSAYRRLTTGSLKPPSELILRLAGLLGIATADVVE